MSGNPPQPLPVSRVGVRSPALPGTVTMLADPGDDMFGSITFFKHPGPTGAGTAIFSLVRIERDVGSGAYGVQCGVALFACQIIACNKKGFLSTSQSRPTQPDLISLDAILLGREYYYHLEDVTDAPDYAICSSFVTWGFPHGQIPQEWMAIVTRPGTVATGSDSGYVQRVLVRDEHCVVTGHRDGCDVAHLIPPAEEDWFHRNGMDIYNSAGLTRDIKYKIHDEGNLFYLRKDLHQTLFDQRYWVIVPRCGVPAVCFIKPTNETSSLYHGRQSHSLRVKAAYLYSRFAWVVLPQAQTAAKQGALKVKVWDASTQTWINGGPFIKPAPKRPTTKPAGPATSKLAKTSINTPPPSAANTRTFMAKVYESGGPDTDFWDSPYYPGQEDMEAKKELLRQRAFDGLGDIGSEAGSFDTAGELKGSDDDNMEEDLKSEGDGNAEDPAPSDEGFLRVEVR